MIERHQVARIEWRNGARGLDIQPGEGRAWFVVFARDWARRSWLRKLSRRGRLHAIAAQLLRPISIGRPSERHEGPILGEAAVLRNRLATPAHREL
jgi:hypothetical protein